MQVYKDLCVFVNKIYNANGQAQTDYRQALRDITETYTSLDDVVWPDKP